MFFWCHLRLETSSCNFNGIFSLRETFDHALETSAEHMIIDKIIQFNKNNRIQSSLFYMDGIRLNCSEIRSFFIRRNRNNASYLQHLKLHITPMIINYYTEADFKMSRTIHNFQIIATTYNSTKDKNNDHIIFDDTLRRNGVFIFALCEYSEQLKCVSVYIHMFIAILIKLFVTRL